MTTYEKQDVKHMAKKNSAANPTQEAIAQRAYEIWEREGQPEGRAAEHWFRAVSELKAQVPETGRPLPQNRPVARRTASRVAENRFQPTG
jgi:hypothetical protein